MTAIAVQVLPANDGVADGLDAVTTAQNAYFHAVAVDDLFVDPSYQRAADMCRARKVAGTWDHKLVGVIEVSDRGAGQHPRYAVVDGQHRWRAALLTEVPVLVAKVHEGLSISDEAALFDRLNRQRVRTGTWDHWRARRSAGDETVVAIERVVNASGLRVENAPREGCVRCTATLEKLAALGGPELVEATLKVILDVWDIRIDAYDAPIVHGIGLILHHLGSQIDMEKLTDTLIEQMPASLKSQASTALILSGTRPVRVAQMIMHLYNRNRNVAGPRISVTPRSFGGGSRNARSVPIAAKSA